MMIYLILSLIWCNHNKLLVKRRDIKYMILPLKIKINELEQMNDNLYYENREYKQKFKKLTKIFGRSQLNELLNTNRIQDNKRKERSNG